MFSPATCLPDWCFCEAVRAIGLMQPVNAYSSLVLTAVGLFILIVGERGWFTYAFAAACAFVGLGSFAYHAQLTLLTQAFDNVGMYLVVLVPLTLLVSRRYALSRRSSLVVLLSFVVASMPVVLIYQGARRYELGILILILLGCEFVWGKRLGTQSRRDLYIALMIFAVSFVIWTMDVTKLWCAPESILQGHATWHILNATAIYFLYKHYTKLAFDK